MEYEITIYDGHDKETRKMNGKNPAPGDWIPLDGKMWFVLAVSFIVR